MSQGSSGTTKGPVLGPARYVRSRNLFLRRAPWYANDWESVIVGYEFLGVVRPAGPWEKKGTWKICTDRGDFIDVVPIR